MTTSNAARPRIVGVLALQGDFREHREMLERLGHEVREVRKPEQLEGLDALIIPGGESTTIARLIQSNGLLQPLRDFCGSGRPTWGTCAGAILMAREVDRLDRPGLEVMDISVRRNAFGRQVDSFVADLSLKGLAGEPFHAVFIRAPVLTAVRPPAGILARLDDGTVVAARQANLLSTSFHPELTGDSRLHEYFLGIGAGAAREPRPVRLPDGAPADLAPFFDAQGRLTAWPMKARLQRAAIEAFAQQFEAGRSYSEREVDEVLTGVHTFGDATMLRRRLIDWGYLGRETNGARYWRSKDAGQPASGEVEATSHV